MAQEGNDLILPAEFSGPAQLLLYTRYGDPREATFEQKWITSWAVQDSFPWFPLKRLLIHKHFWPLLDDAFRELEIYDLHNEIVTIGDCYNVHYLSENQSVLSVHSWGAAIDLNMNARHEGGLCTWSDDFVAIMEKHKVHCGQTWAGHIEPCHFAMVNG